MASPSPIRAASRRYDVGKRVVDVVVALIALVGTAPVQAAVAVLVRRDLGSPVLFRQERPGRNGRPFVMVKFRTMQGAGPVSSDPDRLTPLGRRLRSLSLDELPTLWNVLRGDMSLVGPRPLLTNYLTRYTPDQARRHEVRPGVTGLAQVSGRNALDWEDRLALDVWYVDHRSLRLDLTILARTVRSVLRREGISEQGSATMTEFRGGEDGA